MFNSTRPQLHALVSFCVALCLTASGCDSAEPSETSSETDSGTETETDSGIETEAGPATDTNAAPLSIIGEYADDFGGSHSITMMQWVQVADFGTFSYTLRDYDNDAGWVVGEDDASATFSRFDWTRDASGQLYYCTAAFDAASVTEAVEAPASDPTDPANGGCSMFAWTQLTPS